MAAQLIVHSDFFNKVLKQNRSSLRHATSKQINILVEIVFNLLNSKNIPLSASELEILRPIHTQLITLSRTNSVEAARKILYKLTKSQLTSFIVPALIATRLRR